MQIQQQNEGHRIESQRTSTKIKAEQFQAKLKMKQFMNNRSQTFQQEKLDRIRDENCTAMQKQEEMEKMELWEMELIKKLKNTHEVQKNIYQEYDSLMNESIGEFEKKFKPPQNKKYLSELKEKNNIKTMRKDKIRKDNKIPKKNVVITKDFKEVSPVKDNNNESPVKENLNVLP